MGLVHLRKCRACERTQESQMPFKNISSIKLAKLSHYAFLGREGCFDGTKATKPETSILEKLCDDQNDSKIDLDIYPTTLLAD